MKAPHSLLQKLFCGLLAVVNLLPLGAPQLHAAPGDLDTLNSAVVGNYLLATAVQADGKIIIAGRITTVGVTARSNIARLNADGTLDTGFNPRTNGDVNTVAVQADGKILLGGDFTTVQGTSEASATTRNRIARVNADGTLDTGFNPNASATVNSIAVQTDGKIVLGGAFTQVNSTTRNRVARLNADGTLDSNFQHSPNHNVLCVVVQADGKILLGGQFQFVQLNTPPSNFTARNAIARLNADGTLDTGFNPNVNHTVISMAVQADGKIVLGGIFTAVNSTTRNRAARVNADGTLDTGFDPTADSDVRSVLVQSDGKILLGGLFTTLQPNGAASATTRNYVARVNADGTLDTGFDPKPNSTVHSIRLQADGKILLGGAFTSLQPNGAVSATARNLFARLINDAPVVSAPTVTTPTSAGVTAASATLGGNVTSDGGATVTARGVVYSLTATNGNPQIGGTGVTNVPGTGTTGVFTVNATGLTANSGYSYAAYATNSTGTSYSSVGTFATTTTFDTPGASPVTYSGVISGAVDVTKTGTAVLTLSGPNTYTGTTTVSAGALKIQNNTALGTVAGGTSVTSGAALQMENNITTSAEPLTLNGTGVSADGALRNISGNNDFTGLVTLGSATRINSDAGKLTLSNAGTITGAGLGLSVGGAGDTTINSVIGTTSGGLVKDGAGTLTLTGANTFTGATTISEGNLTLKNTSGSSAYAIAGGATLEINNAANLEFGTTTYSGTGTFKKTGAGQVVWGGGAATFELGSGSLIDVQEGTMLAGNFGNEVWTSNLSDLTVASGATFDGLEANIRVDALNGGGTLKSGYGGGGYQAFTFGVDNGGGTFSGQLTNSDAPGNFVKVGTGTQILSGDNTYTGATTVSAGILRARHFRALGTTAGGTTVSNGATLQLDGNITVGAEALSLNGGAASGQTGALVNLSGTNTYGGEVTVTNSSSISAASGSVLTLTGGVVKNGTVATFNGGGTINVDTVGISGSLDDSDLVVDGTTVNLNVANTYNGPTFIRNSGTLNANVVGALPTGTRSALAFDGTGTSVLTLGAAQSVASLNAAGAATVTLGSNTLTVGTSTGSTTFAGAIGGTGGLTKDGTSAQILSGTNTFVGATTVSAGTLSVTGSIASSSLTTINGGTLMGTGTVGAIQLNSAGAVNLGAGTLTTGNIAITDGQLVFSIGGTSNYGHLNTNGTINLTNGGSGAQLVLNAISGYVATKGDTFTLITNDLTDAIGGNFAGLTEGATIPNFLGTSLTGKITYVGGTGNDMVLSVLAAPPTVTSLNVTSGSTFGGTSVTITGTDFTGATGVTFAGVAASFTVVNDTMISATTPAGAAGPAGVLVTTPSGTNAANTLFTYIAPATVTTATQASVTHNSATLGGNVTSDGGASVTERGIVWGTATGPTTGNNKVPNGSGTGTFSATVTGLPASTLVYVRAYAINSAGTSYGSEISFTTSAPPLVTTTFAYTGADQTYVVPSGVTSITVRLWGAGGGQRGGSGAFVSGLLTVTPGETLTIITGGGGARSNFAQYSYGGGGNGGSFGGGGGGRSAIRRGATELVTAGAGAGGSFFPLSTAACGGAGGLAVGGAGSNRLGVVGGASAGFGGEDRQGLQQYAGLSVFNNVAAGAGGSGYWGGSAATSAGCGGGGGSSFTTNLTSFAGEAGMTGTDSGVAPGGASDPSYVTGVGRGGATINNATGNGGNGLVLIIAGSAAPTPAPTVTSISPSTGSTAGGTSVTITGTDFTGATEVTIGGNVAAIGTVTATTITATTPAGSEGTASVLVTTLGGTNAANTLFTYIAPATVTTATQASVTHNSATLGGNVTADGGASVTERGIVWGTATGPTTGNNKVSNGSGTGTFSATVTGLPASTLVYVRAYAINSVSTSYGSEISFTTSAVPVVTTSFAFTGADQTYVVPAGVTSITVKLWGAGGGVGGGSGAFVSGQLAVTPGETLTIITGGRGGYITSVGSTANAYGGGGRGMKYYVSSAGGGGGRSAIRRGSTELVTAGAGGGGINDDTKNYGGAGGLTAGGAGSGSLSGAGGTQTSGAAQFAGGNSTQPFDDAGGGGSGYWGGYVGTPTAGVAGGGGSSFTTNLTSFSGQAGVTGADSGTAPGGASDPAYVAGVGRGGQNTRDERGLGGAGLVVITTGSAAPTPAPTVTGISPATGSTAGGTSVTITGTDFTGVTGVTIGGTAATVVNLVNPTTITCTTPAGAAGSASVLVTTPAGTSAPGITFTYVAVPTITPVFLGSGGTSGSGTGGGDVTAPDSTGSVSLGRWESIRQGAVLSSNGHISFRGHMEVGTGSPAVTVNDFQGIWKYDGTDTRLKARSGSPAPETSGALFDMLPLNPAISPNGLITFYGTLRIGAGVTASTNLGLWSELGGGSVRLLVREGDTIIAGKTFRSGFAVSGSSVNTAALNARLSTGTAMLHVDVNTPSALITVVAEEGQAAPGGGTWVALDGNSSDPRLSSQGDLGFIGWEQGGSGFIQGIYSRVRTTAAGTSGATIQARAGGVAPGTGGATFNSFERPTVFDGGMAFRGFLNQDGDNVAGNKGQGVWAGGFGSLLPVLRTGDTSAQIATIPAGSSVTSVWSPFCSASGAITMRVGLSNGVAETRAVVGSTGGTMRVIAKVGDAVPGLAGETFTNFDHPVIGDGDQVAFTASTNAGSYGIWKQAPAGGALSLIMKVGDTISTSEGDKVVSQISLPGAATDDRKFESRCMDASGRLLIHVTFPDGSTSLLLGQ